MLTQHTHSKEHAVSLSRCLVVFFLFLGYYLFQLLVDYTQIYHSIASSLTNIRITPRWCINELCNDETPSQTFFSLFAIFCHELRVCPLEANLICWECSIWMIVVNNPKKLLTYAHQWTILDRACDSIRIHWCNGWSMCADFRRVCESMEGRAEEEQKEEGVWYLVVHQGWRIIKCDTPLRVSFCFSQSTPQNFTSKFSRFLLTEQKHTWSNSTTSLNSICIKKHNQTWKSRPKHTLLESWPHA